MVSPRYANRQAKLFAVAILARFLMGRPRPALTSTNATCFGSGQNFFEVGLSVNALTSGFA